MPTTTPRANPLFLSDAELRKAMELLFFAYRDFTAEPDSILARYDFGRAHHRVIYFVGADAGMSVSDLLAILKITKQSLSRVLGQLLREGFIEQQTDTQDRRRRLLFLTPKGQELETWLTDKQTSLIAKAYRDSGAEAVAGFATVLRGIISDVDQKRFVESE